MKKLEELRLKDGFGYAREHGWALAEAGGVRIGISDYAQDQLGDIVYVELPEAGVEFTAGDEFGTLESTKAVSELYMPVAGKILAVNEELEDSPELVNEDPYGRGWLILVELSDPAGLGALMDKDAYLHFLKG